MKEFSLYQVDAFTNKVFGGNPAAVVPLTEWIPEGLMQSIATENNLSETVFFTLNGSSGEIRWFTPKSEVDLCGHATLAAGFVAFEVLGCEGPVITFTSKSGPLTVRKNGSKLLLDFPTREGKELTVTEEMERAFGVKPSAAFLARDLVLLFEKEQAVRDATPDFDRIKRLPGLGTVITARGDSVDFVSRAFFPEIDVPEDPVTGSTHCTLAPLWAKKLGKTALSARQISPRGGELVCTVSGDRTYIEGECVLYMEGKIKNIQVT